MASKVTNFTVNMDDKRLTSITNEESKAIKASDKTYDTMVNNVDSVVNQQQTAIENYKNEQIKNQNEQTEFAIEKIQQQKDQAHKDYLKEQSGAYTDWQKQSNQYGANAEQMAASGLSNTGYSESSQVNMYVAYQNRVATARESYQKAVLEYDNAMTDARLKNNSLLAEIAFNALQQSLQVSMEGLMNKNEILTNKANQQLQIKSLYQDKWKTMLNQINTENQNKEQARQFGLQYAETVRSNKADEEYKRKTLDEKKRANKADEDIRNRSLEETIRANKADETYKSNALDEEKRQFNAKNSGGSSGGSSGGGGGGSYKSPKATKPPKSPKSTKTGTKTKTTTTKTVTSSTANKNNQSPAKIDMNSVLSLGYGPISASKLNDLVSKGIVEEYKQGNMLKYRKVVNKKSFYSISGAKELYKNRG